MRISDPPAQGHPRRTNRHSSASRFSVVPSTTSHTEVSPPATLRVAAEHLIDMLFPASPSASPETRKLTRHAPSRIFRWFHRLVQLNGAAATESGMPYAEGYLARAAGHRRGASSSFPRARILRLRGHQLWRERSVPVRSSTRSTGADVASSASTRCRPCPPVYSGGSSTPTGIAAAQNDGVVGDVCTVSSARTAPGMHLNSTSGPKPGHAQRRSAPLLASCPARKASRSSGRCAGVPPTSSSTTGPRTAPRSRSHAPRRSYV